MSVKLLFNLQTLQLELSRGAPRACEVNADVLARFEAVPINLGQPGGILLLGGEDGEALDVIVQADVGHGSVFRYLLANLHEAQIGGIEAGAGGTKVVVLGVVEGQGLGGDVEDRGRRNRNAIAVSEAGAAYDTGDIDAMCFSKDGARLVNLSHCHSDTGTVAEREIDSGGQGYLGIGGGGQPDKECNERDETNQRARLGSRLGSRRGSRR